MPLTLARALRHTTARHARPRTGPPAAPQGRLLNDGDFTYAGSFRLPAFVGGNGTSFSFGGLTHRYVGGELRFFSTADGNAGSPVYEFTRPASLSTAYDYAGAAATLVRDWGLAPYGGRRWVQDGGEGWVNEERGIGNEQYGLHWDEPRQRLYWSYGHWYNSVFPNNPCLGFATLNDAAGTAQAFGPWRLQNATCKFGQGGACAIPQAWADANVGGRTLGVGFGGNGTTGPAFGAVAHPPAAAFAPPPGAFDPWPHAPLNDARLIGHPTNFAQYTRPLQGKRPPDTRSRVFWYYGVHGRARGGGPDTVQFHSRAYAGSATNFYAGYRVRLTAGPGAGQERFVTAYDTDRFSPTAQTATVSPPWGTPPTDQTDYYVFEEVCQGGTLNSITLAPVTPADGTGVVTPLVYYVQLFTDSGPGQDERRIVAYDGVTKVATVDPPWDTPPAPGTRYMIYGAGTDPASWEPRDGTGYYARPPPTGRQLARGCAVSARGGTGFCLCLMPCSALCLMPCPPLSDRISSVICSARS